MEAGENVRIVNESEGSEVENIVADEDSETVALAEDKSPTFGFTEPSWRTDLCLVVEGTKLYVAKVILSLASPVFDAMFQSDFKEKSNDELELPGKKLRDVLEFLRCIYPNTYTQINCDNARVILPLLEEYQVLQLKPRCEVVILETVTEETSTDDLFQLLNEACLYDLKALRARCIFLISSRPCDVLDENYCKSFPSASALNEIFLHVNTSMKNKIAELEQVEEKCELLMQYVSSTLRGTTDLKLDPEKKWDDKIIVLFEAICPDNNESEGVEIEIWEVPLTIYTKK
ncbi:TD and POZ domain-containing protein 3-like [Ruditapes philippinarum]|uniref:TD and POZ domain-containing protein 3-like n=1 Tax=Ruditapes philippinarum TaxID=129788 RepID=UPI00295BC422|nr:TD and POZ domain-containing protein 3-like [Ruditapes philippinarum]